MEINRMSGTEEAVVVGTEGGPGPTGVPTTTAAAEGAGGSGPRAWVNGQPRPDPAVPEKPVRQRFDAEYEARILREADQLTAPGQLGALLRREGLYSSHLSAWRKQRDEAALAGLVPKRRGRKPDPNAALVAENQRLVRENAKLMRKLRRTETILDVQKTPVRYDSTSAQYV
jgi:transposase